MADLTYVLLIVGVFGIFVLLLRGCDRIVRSGDDGDAHDVDLVATDGAVAAGAER